MPEIAEATEKHNPFIDAAELARTKKFSPARFGALVRHYRARGATDAEIVAAMAASPHLVDPIGRGRG